MLTIIDAVPAMADVFSGAVPRPEELRPGDDVLTWAKRSTAILRLCKQWGVKLSTLRVGLNASGAEDLVEFLGDPGAVVHLAGRLVALNIDGTRAAFYTAGEGMNDGS